MKDRLKQIRLTLGYNQQEIAEKLGFELTTYRSFEYKSKNLPIEFLKALINKFSVNINWLLTGSGNMFISNKEDSEDLSNEEIKTLKKIIKFFNENVN